MADSLFNDQEDLDYIQELTGPGKKFDKSKYADEAEMWKAIAKGKVLADRTVDMQNQRFDELREDFLLERKENTAMNSFDELKKTLLERNTELPTNTNKTEVVQTLTPADVAKQVQAVLAAEKAKEREESNLQQAETVLRQRFGAEAKTVFQDKMNTLGLSDEDVRFLARKSPQALLNALGVNQEQDIKFDAPPRSSLRSDNFKPTVTMRDAVYYEKLRQEQPKEYFSEKTSVQRLKDMDDPEYWTRYNQINQRRTSF